MNQSQGDSTSNGLRKKRDKRALKTGFVGVIAQLLNHCIRLMVIPLSISMLGIEQYGLWVVVGSLVAWGGIADFGLAPGLINVLGAAYGRGDRHEMKQAVSTAFAAYSVIGILIALVAVGVAKMPILPALLGIHDAALAREGRMLVLICGGMFACATMCRVVNTITSALQEGYLSLYWTIAGNLLSFTLLLLYRKSHMSLAAYAMIATAPSLAMQIAQAFHLFIGRYNYLLPEIRWVTLSSLKELLKYAGPLAIYQIANMAILYTPNILIANRLGSTSVALYSVPYSAFAAVMAMIWLLVSPYTAAYAEAAARGDWSWIRRRDRQVTAWGSVVAGLGAGILTLAGPWIIKQWTSGNISTDSALFRALFFFTVIRTASNAHAVMLTGVGQVRIVAVSFSFAAIIFVIASWSILPSVGLIAIPICCSIGHLFTLAVGWRGNRQTMPSILKEAT